VLHFWGGGVAAMQRAGAGGTRAHTFSAVSTLKRGERESAGNTRLSKTQGRGQQQQFFITEPDPEAVKRWRKDVLLGVARLGGCRSYGHHDALWKAAGLPALDVYNVQ
jgi:hypothetical protein